MKEKIWNSLIQVINAVVLAGIILILIGLYYWVVKAGIPYQDPSIELQIQYAVNMGIGDILMKKGFIIAVCGGIVRLLLGCIHRVSLKRAWSSRKNRSC